MKTILFVCTGNTCRSAMAEGLFNRRNPKPESFRAISSGLYTCDGFPAAGNAVQAMHEMGVDIKKHRSRVLTEEILKNTDFVYCMTAVHYDRLQNVYPAYKDKIFMISDHDISDPFGQNIGVYRQCAQELSQAVDQLIQHLTGEPTCGS